MSKKVACGIEGCETTVPIEQFDETAWLPVFKATREHVGYFCPDHVRKVRQGASGERYFLSWVGAEELIIDKQPIEPDPAADPAKG